MNGIKVEVIKNEELKDSISRMINDVQCYVPSDVTVHAYENQDGYKNIVFGKDGELDKDLMDALYNEIYGCGSQCMNLSKRVNEKVKKVYPKLDGMSLFSLFCLNEMKTKELTLINASRNFYGFLTDNFAA
jgi:hypothetical protein